MTRPRALGWVALLPSALLACQHASTTGPDARIWSEVRGSVFTLRSDADPAFVARMARDLELFIAVVRATVDVTVSPPARPLQIYAIDDPELMLDIGIGGRTGIGGTHSATAHGSIILSDVSGYRDATRTILYHELTHFLLTRSGAYVPLWYHEGFADFLSSVHSREGLVSVGRFAPLRARSLEALERLPVVDLVSTQIYPRDGEAFVRFYATAWLFVHFLHTAPMEDGGTLRPHAVEYLQRLASGEAWEDAFASSFASGPGAIDRALGGHLERVRAGHLRLIHLHAPDLEPATPGPISSVSPAAAAADIAEVLLSRERRKATKAAISVLENALVRDPDDPNALAALALAKSRHFQPPAGEAEIAKALRRGEANPRVHLQAGRLRLVRARRSDPIDRDELARARQQLRRATELDASFAGAWAELGGSYTIDGMDDPPEPGIEALEQARALAPADTAVLLDLATLHARAGDRELAKAYFERVLGWSGSEAELKEARDGLKAIGE
jgi:tetratricopeptide (TPR) repeat protein